MKNNHYADMYSRDAVLVRPKHAKEADNLVRLSRNSAGENDDFERRPPEDIKFLRIAQTNKKSESMPLSERLNRFVSSLCEDLALVFAPNGPKSRMCDNYGHQIDYAGWKAGLPRCIDCGAIINEAEEVRKSKPFPGNHVRSKFWTEPTRD